VQLVDQQRPGIVRPVEGAQDVSGDPREGRPRGRTRDGQLGEPLARRVGPQVGGVHRVRADLPQEEHAQHHRFQVLHRLPQLPRLAAHG
jgi:hypothetical protein